MNTAKLAIKSLDSKKIYESLIPEIASMDSERSSVKLKALKDELLIEISAKDINALKIVNNHLLRLIAVFEDAAKIKGE